MSEWISLEDVWDKCLAAAEARDKQKKHYNSTRNYSKYSTHFVGLLGEEVVSKMTSMPVNYDLLVDGDGGSDWTILGKTHDIKGIIYWRDPELKEEITPRHWKDYYLGVALDMDNKKGRYIGWATMDELKNAGRKNYGYGEKRFIRPEQLRTGYPPELEQVAYATV